MTIPTGPKTTYQNRTDIRYDFMLTHILNAKLDIESVEASLKAVIGYAEALIRESIENGKV